LAAASLAAVVIWAPQTASAQRSDSPLRALTGEWTGNGSITMNDGNRERIRCRASYGDRSGGSETQIDLRCASDSYKFELSAQVVYRDGQISGNWTETTRSVAGNLTGTATPSRIDVRAIGQTFAALLVISTRSDSQTVSIKSPGSQMQEVAITLARR
jgi:hypothetical protein